MHVLAWRVGRAVAKRTWRAKSETMKDAPKMGVVRSYELHLGLSL